ncbi:MAG TPA: SDR family oxidoreductase [Steroidobacteraceae bacterium]|jgi:short-subunit dehydrogenase|nr:SDR family oxidoreductase [Steroidobacteraceae bacterium]
MKRVLIIGATSALAEATARRFAASGDALFLVGRSPQRLQAIADDLTVRGASRAQVCVLDVRDISAYQAVLDEAWTALGGLDFALIAHGTLSDQAACQRSVAALLDEFQVNALSVMALCTLLAERFAEQKRGVIAVISSVAGDRGRGSNYVYGSAKAAVSAFTSGLRQRLRPSGVAVVTIKPGFVDTPMTANFKKGLLWATPAGVGKEIAAAMIAGTPVIYTPGFWRPVMWIIRSLPEFVFRRLSL